MQESPKDVRELRILILILAVDLFTTFGQVIFQLAQIRGGEDPLRYIRNFQGLWIRAAYARELTSLGTLDDEVSIAQTTGQSQALIREWVTSRLKDFVRSRSRTANC